MKRFLMQWMSLAGALAVLVFSDTLAQEKAAKPVEKETVLTGYVVDRMCGTGMAKRGGEKAMEMAARHSKACALEEGCRESGYGLVSGGKFYKFDQKGDELALKYLEATTVERGHFLEVKGIVEGDMMKVTSLVEAAKEQKGKGGLKEAKPKM